ncbi:PilZ domain-containing protein [Methylomonas methanica]|uniref:Cyclic diguanosine monophosphate-binding protein n=1 Tax=Methylomonas methanica (strain DSM 25384 / MC09) TaxID=857087 RepID=G0A007_METMM|nr:PilZ domain-containing protein [Methylomonas methanica]AEG01146.1 type IV pilus assembly PilZ [Methylomonas methanica MC09]
MTKSDQEKRHYQRILYNTDAVLTDGDTEMACKVIDISLKGCLLGFENKWPGNPVNCYPLRFTLSNEVTISMVLKFSHGSDTQVGFKCEHIDIDSITNLRRLVELNLGDSEILSRELDALCGLSEK